jgi:hypothetical protein
MAVTWAIEFSAIEFSAIEFSVIRGVIEGVLVEGVLVVEGVDCTPSPNAGKGARIPSPRMKIANLFMKRCDRVQNGNLLCHRNCELRISL